VFVIGAGLAGMEAARTAAKRGHRAKLFEKNRQTGGAMLIQAMIPTKSQVENLTRYLTRQAIGAGVELELGKAVTPEYLQAEQPDVLVIAVGADSITPDIPGVDKEHVVSSGAINEMMSGGGTNGESIRSGWRGQLISFGAGLMSRPLSLSARKKLSSIGIPIVFGKRVAVLGSDLTACQLADFLSENGRVVTILAKDEELGADLPTTLQNRLLDRLVSKKVRLLTGLKDYVEITDSGVVVTDSAGKRQVVAANSIIPMLGMTTDNEKLESFRNVAPEVHAAGDCAEPLKLLHAVHDGARTVGVCDL
jgi:NADPH-dependent 2,4-dienoyl-CoA reductase/sulfur reductase-like enzyme